MVSPSRNAFSSERVMFEAGERQQVDAVLSFGEIRLHKIIDHCEERLSPRFADRVATSNAVEADEPSLFGIPKFETQTSRNVTRIKRSRAWRLQFLKGGHRFG